MRYLRLFLCLATFAFAAGCEDDSGITDGGPPEPQALVRFINLNVDTGTVDLRFIDKVENLPTLLGVAFRGSSGMYQRADDGTRPTRVFPNSSNIDLTRIVLVDTSVALAPETRFTFLYAGRVNAGQDRLAVFNDPEPPSPPAGQIALKALHGAFGTAAVDVYIVAVDSLTQATPANFATVNAGVIRNVGYLSQSAYINVPVRPTTGARFYRFVVTPANTATASFAATPNQPGTPTPPGQLYSPQPGVQITGSVMTIVIAPGSIAGTRQSTAATQAPTVFLVPDKSLTAP